MKKKSQFYEKLQIQNGNWNFQTQMKIYLMEKGDIMLDAAVKLCDLSFKIQQFLKNNYHSMAEWKNVGLIFRVNSVRAFFYSLMLHILVI